MNWDIIPGALTSGSLYALIALSFNVIVRPTNVFNFAQGGFAMVGAMVGAVFITTWALPWLLGALMAVLVVAGIGVVVNRVAVTPILRRAPYSDGWVISTLGVSLIISNIVGKFWGAEPRPIAPPPGLSLKSFHLGPVDVSSYRIFLVLLTIALMVGIEFFYKTGYGRAIRAVAEDREAALLRGINPDRLTQVSFAAGGGLAALAGILAAPILLVSTSLASTLLIYGFMAVAIGGVGNNRGALIGGYVLGLSQALGAYYLAPGYQSLCTFVILLVILSVRPNGILSTGRLRHV